MKLLRLALLVVVFAITGATYALEVAISRIAVITAANATETERFAAEELRRYLGDMAGVTIPDTADANSYPIYIGQAAPAELQNRFDSSVSGAGPDSFLIKVKANDSAIVGGGDRGTLYGVYELLESQGCRWFFPGELGEVIPQREKLDLAEGEQTFVPDFVQRSIDIGNTDGIDFESIIDWVAKNRLNYAFSLRDYFVARHLPPEKSNAWRKRGGLMEWQWIVHNFSFMLPTERYFDTNPEYYAFYKGKRVPLGTPGKPGFGGGNLCTTNPDVIQRCAEFAIDYFDRTPSGSVVPMWPGDGAIIWCECPNCKKLKGFNFMPGKRGSMTRRMVTFANAVAREVGQRYPDRKILCPAYANYVLPEEIALEPNILLQFCLHGDYAHAVDGCDQNAEERKMLEAWAKQAAGRMGLWEYFLLGDHYSAPTENAAMLPVLYRIRDSFPYFKSIGINWYYTQSSPKYWKHNIAAYYFTARYTWQADRDFNALLNDFCQKMYGAAGSFLEQYYRLIEDQVAQADWHPTIYSDLTVPSPKVFTPEVLARAESLLKQAQECQLSPIEQKRLALVRTTFHSIQQNVGTQQMLGLDANADWRIARGADTYVINPDGREMSDLDVQRIVTNAMDNGSYTDELKRILFRARKREVPLLKIANSAVEAAVIPELGGRIIRLIDRATGKNYFEEPAGTSITSIGEKYYNYGGYEEYIGTGFAGPGWENAFSAQEADGVIKMELTTDDWKLQRSVRLLELPARGIVIESTLTNLTGETQKTALRSHPALQPGAGCGDYTVLTALQDGTIAENTVAGEHDVSVQNHAGARTILQPDGQTGIAYFVEPANAGTLYLCKTSDSACNLELLGTPQNVAPGESFTIRQEFRLLSGGAAEFQELVTQR